jgi:hypothetical protein
VTRSGLKNPFLATEESTEVTEKGLFSVARLVVEMGASEVDRV